MTTFWFLFSIFLVGGIVAYFARGEDHQEPYMEFVHDDFWAIPTETVGKIIMSVDVGGPDMTAYCLYERINGVIHVREVGTLDYPQTNTGRDECLAEIKRIAKVNNARFCYRDEVKRRF